MPLGDSKTLRSALKRRLMVLKDWYRCKTAGKCAVETVTCWTWRGRFGFWLHSSCYWSANNPKKKQPPFVTGITFHISCLFCRFVSLSFIVPLSSLFFCLFVCLWIAPQLWIVLQCISEWPHPLKLPHAVDITLFLPYPSSSALSHQLQMTLNSAQSEIPTRSSRRFW